MHAEGTSICFVQWGRGKRHVHVAGSAETVCGKAIPFPVRAVIYGGSVCTLCAKDAAAVAAAEATRKQHWAQIEAMRNDALAKSRAGLFTVHRCRLCGAQHSPPRDGGGVPFCMAAHHVAELEEVAVRGPVWTAPK